MSGGEEGWMVVQRHRSNRNRVGVEQGLMNFFFRNFPETCSVEELRRKFEKVGRVEDIFIPGKRDKAGKRFGFVRFRKGEGADRILEQLNNVWIGSYIIRAFEPKFD